MIIMGLEGVFRVVLFKWLLLVVIHMLYSPPSSTGVAMIGTPASVGESAPYVGKWWRYLWHRFFMLKFELGEAQNIILSIWTWHLVIEAARGIKKKGIMNAWRVALYSHPHTSGTYWASGLSAGGRSPGLQFHRALYCKSVSKTHIQCQSNHNLTCLTSVWLHSGDTMYDWIWITVFVGEIWCDIIFTKRTRKPIDVNHINDRS